MKYKTELHCHSEIGSLCSSVSEKDVVEKYIEHGYSTLVLTNHFSRSEREESLTNDMLVDIMLNAYDAALEAAKGRLNVILGMEFRADFKTIRDPNDYLVYGVTREFLKANSNILYMETKDAYKLFKENGMIMIQAHPFRFGQRLVSPKKIDGYEIFNGHLEQCSHNDMAKAWADRFKHHNLILTSGSDHHDDIHYPTGGITTDFEIKTSEQLLDVLKSGNYELITCDLDKLTLCDDMSVY